METLYRECHEHTPRQPQKTPKLLRKINVGHINISPGTRIQDLCVATQHGDHSAKVALTWMYRGVECKNVYFFKYKHIGEALWSPGCKLPQQHAR